MDIFDKLLQEQKEEREPQREARQLDLYKKGGQ